MLSKEVKKVNFKKMPKKELEEEILQYQFNYKNNLYEEI